MVGALDAEARHLALDDAWVGAQATIGQRLEEDLRGRLAEAGVKRRGGKSPGRTG